MPFPAESRNGGTWGDSQEATRLTLGRGRGRMFFAGRPFWDPNTHLKLALVLRGTVPQVAGDRGEGEMRDG